MSNETTTAGDCEPTPKMSKQQCATCSLVWCGKGIGCVAGGPCKAECEYKAGIPEAQCNRCKNLVWNGSKCVIKKKGD